MEEKAGYMQWTVPGPKAVFLLVHGIGTYSGRWEATANFFLANGISSYAVECREAGEYSGAILRLRETVSKENPGKKIFLVGESLGGLVSFLAACRHGGLFDGLVCLSPAFKSRLKLSFTDYLKIFASLLYDPKREFSLPFDSSMCTRDEDYRKKMEADERESPLASSRSITGILLYQAVSWMSAPRLNIPVLFLLAGDDKIVDPAAAASLFRRIGSGDKTLKEYPGMYHSLSVDAEKEKVFGDILRWVLSRTGKEGS